jgi:hypothetical protein
VLERMEGHFTRGYGDRQSPDVEIELLPGAAGEAREYLFEHPGSLARLDRVAALIDGFETPYGMELLSSVHWVALTDAPAPRTAEEAVQAVHNWNERKRAMFRPDHIHIAWDRLLQEGWLPKVESR